MPWESFFFSQAGIIFKKIRIMVTDKLVKGLLVEADTKNSRVDFFRPDQVLSQRPSIYFSSTNTGPL